VRAALGPAALLGLTLARAGVGAGAEHAADLRRPGVEWPPAPAGELVQAPPAPLPLLLTWGPAPDAERARVEAAALAVALGLDLPPRPGAVLLDGMIGGLHSLRAAWSAPGSAVPARLPAPRPLPPGRGRALPGSGVQGQDVPLSVLIARVLELGPAGAPGDHPAAHAARAAAALRLGGAFPDPAGLPAGTAGLLALEAAARGHPADRPAVEALAQTGPSTADRVAARVALRRWSAVVGSGGGQPAGRR
jgi:hypothetical protein